MVGKALMLVSLFAALLLNCGWVGVDVKPLEKSRSDLASGQSGTYYQLSDTERKELVWMAKAASAAYKGVEKPLGYRSFTRTEWDACAENCNELCYTEDGYFTVGSGLRGRLMVNMINEGRVVLALCGTDDLSDSPSLFELLTSKDIAAAREHYKGSCSVEQYEQAKRLMLGVLKSKPRSELWIVGHSLGGSLATYLALEIPESRTKIKCATFNGFGYSPFRDVSPEKAVCASRRIRNVYADGDIVYNWNLPLVAKVIGEMIIPPKHLGPSYSLIGEGTGLEQHKLAGLLKLMIKHRTKWQGL